ncbi:Predicted choloylglycine hydrolase [Salinibacillus kushneri]|uniref:Predicted choloylglycine hydrolase n=1 Tax=Salinibacillus kushneri TaxID=237682 RepID=A0A1I0ISL3_9BACI|nr:C45 family peptidase [Salinibacillus kushneri]SET99452.1 Predicted choloylglycine hydrolase [Salinibacillus kushneri]
MKQIYSDIIQFRGSHYEFGRMQGAQLKDSLIVKNRERQWKVRKPRFSVDEKEAKDNICRFAPGIWEEIIGLQDALEWPMERVLMEFSGYRLPYARSGCSILTGENYFIRNYDYHPKTYEGRYALFQPGDQGYATIGPEQKITGRPDGINEKGLVLGYNFMHRKKPGEGFICHMIGRMILETCANADEAVDMLKEIPHRHSFSFIAYDQRGEALVVEASPRGTEVRQSTVCTNHFEIMKEENRHHLVDSYERLEAMERGKSSIKKPYDAFRLLNDTDKGVFSKQYKNWAGTIHTSAYFPKERKAWFALGGDQEPLEINFGKWVDGDDLELNRIYGEVDTDLPFVHMNEKATWFK